MADFFTIENFLNLLVLIFLQAVLGFDNLLYISIESKRAPAENQAAVRKMDANFLADSVIWSSTSKTSRISLQSMVRPLTTSLTVICQRLRVHHSLKVRQRMSGTFTVNENSGIF